MLSIWIYQFFEFVFATIFCLNTLELSGPRNLKKKFLELQKRYFSSVVLPIAPAPSLVVVGPLVEEPFLRLPLIISIILLL